MDMPHGRVAEATPTAYEDLAAYEDLDPSILSPLDPAEALDLHRAINERRAQLENAEMLRRLRSL